MRLGIPRLCYGQERYMAGQVCTNYPFSVEAI